MTMNAITWMITVAALSAALLTAAGAAAQTGSGGLTDPASRPAGKPRVIFDTDMAGDCDDVAALALLHILADRGEVEILATVASNGISWSVACVDAINTFYGRPELPVGAPKGEAATRPSLYAQGVSESLPHRLTDGSEAPDAVEVIRKALESSPDGSVTVVTVGYLTNIARLLQRPAEGDHLSGMDLVKKKVKLWACMGGNFVGKPAKDDLELSNVNFTRDAAGALYAITHWPVKLMFVGREIGSVPSGLEVGARFAELPQNHPLHLGYKLYFKGEVKSRHVADPTTVLYAVRGLGDYWDAETRGYMDLKSDMHFEWKYDHDSLHGYLLKKQVNGQPNDRQIEGVIESLLLEPAHGRTAPTQTTQEK